MKKNPPVFSKRAFWSDDVTKLNKDTDGPYIIARVFDAGTYEDMQQAIQYYGRSQVESALLDATDLQSSTIAHAAIWLDRKPEDFRAFRRSQLNPMPYATF